MHKLNTGEDLHRLSAAEFSRRALTLPANSLREELIPLLTDSSRRFVGERVEAANRRTVQNFAQYELSSPADLTPVEYMTEALYDRQFLRSAKENVTRATLAKKVAASYERREPIQMVIPALPFKCVSPLKSRGPLPDLAEIGFLLSVFEIAKTVDTIYRDAIDGSPRGMAFFTIISDGRRFNGFLSEPDERIARYQSCVTEWIEALSIGDYVGIEDYASLLNERLGSALRDSKEEARKEVYGEYRRRMGPLLDPVDMNASMANAIRLEPDPETFCAEGRFVPLLKSLVYTINYQVLAEYAESHGEDFERVYAALTKHIFAPFTRLADDDVPVAREFATQPARGKGLSKDALYEYLRQEMLHKVWDATMRYLAEIRSDRDLVADPISACFRDAIRWTIHAKRGQLAIQTNPASGIQVQSWHGAGVFKRTRKSRIKLCSLPCALLESAGAVPVIVDSEDIGAGTTEGDHEPGARQPIFYLHPDLGVSTYGEFLEILRAQFTRRRK